MKVSGLFASCKKVQAFTLRPKLDQPPLPILSCAILLTKWTNLYCLILVRVIACASTSAQMFPVCMPSVIAKGGNRTPELGRKAPTCNQHKAHSCTGVKTAKMVNNYCTSPGVMTSPGGFDRPIGLVSPLTESQTNSNKKEKDQVIKLAGPKQGFRTVRTYCPHCTYTPGVPGS